MIYSLHDHRCDANLRGSLGISNHKELTCDVADAQYGEISSAGDLTVETFEFTNTLRMDPPASATVGVMVRAQWDDIDLNGSTMPVFKTRVGCGDGPNCDVGMVAFVYVAGQCGMTPIAQIPAITAEVPDDSVQSLELDLTGQSGMSVCVQISVNPNGTAATDDELLLDNPRIVEAG